MALTLALLVDSQSWVFEYCQVFFVKTDLIIFPNVLFLQERLRHISTRYHEETGSSSCPVHTTSSRFLSTWRFCSSAVSSIPRSSVLLSLWLTTSWWQGTSITCGTSQLFQIIQRVGQLLSPSSFERSFQTKENCRTHNFVKASF